jgi:catechol 2,3-dioxygenase-like lactoylglutathione lyase family enzyme
MRMSDRWLAVVGIMAVAVALIVQICWAAESRSEASSADTAGRPKVLGIAYVTFKVTDPEKALDFYGGELGLNGVAGNISGSVGARMRGSKVEERDFAVNQYQRVTLNTEPAGSGSNFVEIGLATDDLAKMRDYLIAKAVSADPIATAWGGSKYLITRDPEGNRIVFLEQKRSETETGVPGAISHRLLHAGIIVKDAQAENRFYEDVLGFHLYWRGGMKEDETNWMAMQVPDGTDWIEYMLRIPPDADKRTRGVMYHISLGVPSMAAAAKELQAKGYKFEEPKIGRDGKWQLNLYDPDDTRVELMEFTPVQKPCCSEFTGPHPKQ